MILYLDTSALLKLYVAEPESPLVGQALASAKLVCTHLIAYAEARAAFAKAQRNGRLEAARLAPLVQEFERDWAEIDVLGVDEALVRRAGELAERFALRGYDSVHLSAGETVMRLAGRAAECRFAAFDARLNDAARKLGMPLLSTRVGAD